MSRRVRSICLFLPSLFVFLSAFGADSEALHPVQFAIRDPFVLAENGKYYLYESKAWNGGTGVNVFVSDDLKAWQPKVPVMTLDPSLKVTAVWAPEVHKYRGRYWLFVTLSFADDGTIKPMCGAKSVRHVARRGTWIFGADSPMGPFKPVRNGSVTPADWMALDGTLYVEDGKPYMVFCHEWCQVGDGRMMLMPLKDDLSGAAGEPVELFRASVVKGANVTDGAFFYRSPKSGKLFMTWSTCTDHYTVRLLVSESGKVAGPWKHCPKELFAIDGGHGMFFSANDGRLLFALHTPNSLRPAHMRLFEVTDAGDTLRFEGEAPETSRTTLEAWPIACDEVKSVAGEEPSYLPKGRKFKLVWNDEFNGDRLDESKWSYRTNFWGRRFKAFADHGAEVKGGKVHLPVMFEDGQYCSPHLQTGELLWDMPQKPCGWGFWPFPKRRPAKFAHKYGYYECRCRLQQKEGWWSAFWLQSPAIGATLDPKKSGIECDIMESFQPGIVLPSCFHYNGYGFDYKGFKSDLSAGDAGARGGRGIVLDKTQFHTFGCLWEPDGYTFFVDGRRKDVKTGRGPGEAVSDVEQFVLISTECKWYRNNLATGEGVPELKDALGDEFIVDYVRVYDEVK